MVKEVEKEVATPSEARSILVLKGMSMPGLEDALKSRETKVFG